jgi:hypothetical protein
MGKTLMKLRMIDKPMLGFLILAAASLLALKLGGAMEVRTDNDSADYMEPRLFHFPDALTCNRTLGYPFFLKAVQTLSPSFADISVAQFAAHVLAVFVFFRGLRALGAAGWPALACASPLLFSPILHDYVGAVLSDSLGSSLSILTVGTFLGLVGQPLRRLWWAGLTLSLFLTYQTRPVYLCMLPLLPVLGFLLLRRQAALVGSPFQAWRVAFGLLAVCLGPYLAFCTLRWATVGHFGLVSFGGRNIIGIPGQFMTHRLADRLPADLRPVALVFLDHRQEVIQQMYDRKHSMTPPHLMKAWGPVPDEATRLDYKLVSQMYAPTINVYYYLLNASCRGDEVAINNKMTALSLAVIKSRPTLYLVWLSHASWNGISCLIQSAIAPNSLTLLFTLGMFFGVIHAVGSCWRTSPLLPSPPGRRNPPLLLILFLVAVGFAACNLALIVLVEVPIGRYLDAAGVFLPTIPLAALTNRLKCDRRDGAGAGYGLIEGTDTGGATAGDAHRSPDERGGTL